MNALLDTHALLWWLFDDPELPASARRLIEDPDNSIFVSAASAWEIATKYRLGRLPDARPLVENFRRELDRAGFNSLDIRLEHAVLAGSFDALHRDPFDRMIAAQSRVEGLPIISRDPALGEFPVRLMW